MGREAGPGAAPGEAATAGGASPSASRGGRPRRAALGGRPAQDRELRAQGRQTLRNLLEAGLAEFDERGFQAVRVDDIVRRAQISHGTFYLYFSNKEDLFKALLRDALHDMSLVTNEFPVVTRNAAGLAALRHWVHEFCETYAAHAAVIRTLSQAEHAELTAVACLMMLERVNYLLTVEVRLPREEMEERIASIMFAAFNPPV